MEKVSITDSTVIDSIKKVMPVASTTENGLMPSTAYMYGDRYVLNLYNENNLGKCVVVTKLTGQYRRAVIEILGIFENTPIKLLFGLNTRTDVNTSYVLIKNITFTSSVEFYKKVIDNSFYLCARSTGTKGNPCVLQINSIGSPLEGVGEALEYDESFTKISIPT